MLLGFLLAIVAMIHQENVSGHVSGRLLLSALVLVAAIVMWALSLGTRA